MLKPLNGMKLNESSLDGMIKVVVFERVIIEIALENLLIAIFVSDVLPLKSVRAV